MNRDDRPVPHAPGPPCEPCSGDTSLALSLRAPILPRGQPSVMLETPRERVMGPVQAGVGRGAHVDCQISLT